MHRAYNYSIRERAEDRESQPGEETINSPLEIINSSGKKEKYGKKM